MAKFERVNSYQDARFPVRKTEQSAGYDFFVAEDTLIPPYEYLRDEISNYNTHTLKNLPFEPVTLKEVAEITKATNTKVTLIPTGIKAKLDPGTYLELSVRSSCPLKHWLILGNSVGIIDADYYNNPDNEGHIYFQIINLSPLPIILRKGDCVGQGIIKSYLTTEDDTASGSRTGGFGSTDA